MWDKRSILLLSQVGIADAISDIWLCTGQKFWTHMHIHLYTALAFLQPTRFRRDQNEKLWALQDFHAGWLKAELLNLGTHHTTQNDAVYFRKYSKHVTDFSGGFWWSEDIYLKVTPNIALKCNGPTQQKYSCWENLHKGTFESIWKSSKTRTNKNKSKVIIPQHQRKTTWQMFSWGHMAVLPLPVSKAVPNTCKLFLTAVCPTWSVKTFMDEGITVS